MTEPNDTPEHLRAVPRLAHLTTGELAERWRLAPKTLSNWRHKMLGPPFQKAGRRITYPVPGILAFEKKRTKTPVLAG